MSNMLLFEQLFMIRMLGFVTPAAFTRRNSRKGEHSIACHIPYARTHRRIPLLLSECADHWHWFILRGRIALLGFLQTDSRVVLWPGWVSILCCNTQLWHNSLDQHTATPTAVLNSSVIVNEAYMLQHSIACVQLRQCFVNWGMPLWPWVLR